MIVHITAADIEYSDTSRMTWTTPLENAMSTRWPGTTVTTGKRKVRVFSKIHGDRQWAYSDALTKFLADWAAGKRVKPGYFRLREITED